MRVAITMYKYNKPNTDNKICFLFGAKGMFMVSRIVVMSRTLDPSPTY